MRDYYTTLVLDFHSQRSISETKVFITLSLYLKQTKTYKNKKLFTKLNKVLKMNFKNNYKSKCSLFQILKNSIK